MRELFSRAASAIFLGIAISIVLQARPMTSKQVAARLDSILARTEGTFAVAWRELHTGRTFFRNPDTVFHAASTMKTPVMIEVFRQARYRKFSLDDSLPVVNEFRSIIDGSPFSLDKTSDSDTSLYERCGKKVSVRRLLDLMITVSSNLATNILIEKVGAANVVATMRTLGAKRINVLRGVEDSKAYAAGKNNTTTARDLLMVFERIARGTAVSRSASREMMAILRKQQHREMIPALLPPEVIVAHKTGSITGIEHDSGIVVLPDGRSYVLVVLSKNLRDPRQGVAAIAAVSRLMYEYTVL